MVQNENPTRCRDWKFEKVVWHILHIKVIFDKSIYGIICVNVRKELNIWKCCLLPGQMKKCLEWVAKSQFSTNFQHAAVAIRNISKLYNLTKDTAIELVFIKKIFILLLSQKPVENGNIWTALKGDKNVLFCKNWINFIWLLLHLGKGNLKRMQCDAIYETLLKKKNLNVSWRKTEYSNVWRGGKFN